MSRALPGEHYCEKHQGNHSHYDEHNCVVCCQQAIINEAVGLLRGWTDGPDGGCEEGTIADPPCGKCYRCLSRDFIAKHGKEAT